MFYSTQILSKKGALGTIWIASHLEKRLKRSQIFETSIPASVDSIINPEAPLALRLSGQLLLGIVRVYFRKLDYLSKDAQSAVDNLNKSASQGVNVDLEDEGRAAYGAITLAEPGDELAADAFIFQAGAASGGLDSSHGGGRGFQPTYSHGDSLAPVEDVSELFGSQWAIEDEKFEASGDEIDRRFSIELERLRAEAAPPPPGPGDMFFQATHDDDLTVAGPDELMAVPGNDYFALGPAATPAKTPLPEPPSAGAAAPLADELPITPPSVGGLALLPDVGGGPTGSGGTFPTFDDAHLDESGPQQTPLSAARQRATGAQEGPSPAAQQKQKPPPRRRRKAAQLDVDSRGQPATALPVKEIRMLLMDRIPLMRPRGQGGRGGQSAALPPDRFDVVAQIEEARHSLLFRPAVFSTLAPELVEVYSRAMGLGGAWPGGAGAATPRQPEAAAAEAAGPAAGAGAGAAEGEVPASEGRAGRGEQKLEGPFSAGPLSAGDFSAGDFEFNPSVTPGDELPPGAYEQDLIEPDTQQAAPFPAGPEEGAEPGLSGRRGSWGGQLGPLGEEEEEGSEALSASQLPKDSFTARSRHVLAEYRTRFVPGTGSKRRHPSAGGLAATQLSLFDVVAGRQRLEACRWFYETLVLRNNDYVELEQREPYGDITIHAKPKLATTEDTTPPV